MKTTANEFDVMRIINAEHCDPFCVLGMHYYGTNKKQGLSVRTYQPEAQEVTISDLEGSIYKLDKIHESGFFEGIIKGRIELFKYKLNIKTRDGVSWSTFDPYSFLPVITEYDLYLYNEGNHHRIYEKLGAHYITIDGVSGTCFSVWAPCAKRVSVIGSFNCWDGRRHQMRCLGSSGVYEIFIPGVCPGDMYKYEIKTQKNEIYVKSDPYAFFGELRPGTASIVFDLEKYNWNDENWLRNRDEKPDMNRPVSVYEVHLGSWARKYEEENRFLSYLELSEKLIPYVKEMGYTHIELLPVAEHPYDGSWGYQVTGYYAITSRYGNPDEFRQFVDKCHQEGIGVILDWVPAHFPKDAHGLANFDGSALYEHADPKQGEHPDWGTLIFNFGRVEVRNFLISNAVFLFEKYHIDGLRVDAVASMLYLDYGKKGNEWIANRWGGKENVDAINFLRYLNTTVYGYFPGIMMIAEESTSWAMVSRPAYIGGLGFSHKWNMGWMNDFLRYVSLDPVYRKYHHNLITFSLIYSFSENFILVLSHDEVVHGKCSMINKMPGDYWQKFAGLRVTYGFMYGHPGKKLLFMGGEFGQFIEWNYENSLDWHLLDYEMHKKLRNYVKDLNKLYKNEKAMYELDFSHEGFQWIDCNDTDHGIVSFLRKGKDWHDMLIFIYNFTPVYYGSYRIGVPFNLYYTEILNSDSDVYGGSNKGNLGGVHANEIAHHGMSYSVDINVPPYGMVVFRPVFNEASY